MKRDAVVVSGCVWVRSDPVRRVLLFVQGSAEKLLLPIRHGRCFAWLSRFVDGGPCKHGSAKACGPHVGFRMYTGFCCPPDTKQPNETLGIVGS